MVETRAELPFIGDQVSRPAESHRRALAEPYVTLSRHTAPIVQPRPRKRLCPSRGAPPIAGWPQVRTEQRSPFAPAPLQSLHHYYELPRPCAPHRYSDPRGGLPLGSLPSHRGDRFPRSVQEPGSESRRLHAGCRLGRNQDTPQTRPGLTTSPRFRHRLYAFDRSSAVCSLSSL